MFKSILMRRVTVYCLHGDAQAVALALAEVGVLHPEESPTQDLPDFPGHDHQQVYQAAHARLEKIQRYATLEPSTVPSLASRTVGSEELSRLNETLGEWWRDCSQAEEQARTLDEENKRVLELSQTLENFAGLDIDLSLLQGNTRFLDVRVGTVPLQNFKRLRDALQLARFFVSVFRTVGDHAHLVVTGLRETHTDQEIGALLDAAGWRALSMPTEFTGHPEQLKRDLENRQVAVNQARTALHETQENRNRAASPTMVEAIQVLRLAAPYAEVAGVLRASGALAMLQGWVPRHDVPRLHEHLKGRITNPFVLESRVPTADERLSVPTLLQHPRWLSPFLSLVQNYGIPRYGEFDPTGLFAVTYILMFGAMFGDLGQGAIIAGVGVYFRQRLGSTAVFLGAIGTSSMVFGVLYGSVFGYETLLPALWMSPLSSPNRMLILALYWGIGFIVLSTVITIRNRLVEGHILEALFDRKGLAGILTYVGLLWGGYSWVTQGILTQGAEIGIFAPLLVVLAYQWYETRLPLQEKILVVFIEGFETIVNYLSNTLSFLRVAAFSLNHVALAIAIFTIAGMLGTAGHWITVVLGNVFILVLEGGIVAIQVLRLEYYEGFSRFFRGDGRAFKPLQLRHS